MELLVLFFIPLTMTQFAKICCSVMPKTQDYLWELDPLFPRISSNNSLTNLCPAAVVQEAGPSGCSGTAGILQGNTSLNLVVTTSPLNNLPAGAVSNLWRTLCTLGSALTAWPDVCRELCDDSMTGICLCHIVTKCFLLSRVKYDFFISSLSAFDDASALCYEWCRAGGQRSSGEAGGGGGR